MRQEGVALITVMVVVAIVVGVAAGILREHQLDIRRAENVLHGNQGIVLLLALETWARELLLDDGEESEVDHQGESWAQVLTPIEADGGLVQGRIMDQQGLFNLNNLIDAEGRGDPVGAEHFRRLVELAGEIDSPASVAEAVVDWLDSDQEATGLGGREDFDYAVQDPAYRTPGFEMSSPTELLLVDGVSFDAWERLRPLVTALPKPDGKPTPVNVNTAPAKVIAAVTGLDLGEASDIVEERKGDHFAGLDPFRERIRESLGESAMAEIDFTRLGTRSDFFLVESSSSFGDVALHMSHLIERTEEGTRVLARGLGNAW